MLVVSFPEAELRDAVGEVPGVESVLWDPGSDEAGDERIEVVVAPYLGAAQRLAPVADLPRCRLVQLQSAGYDGVLEVVPERIAVANAAGVYDAPTAELTLGLTLASLRGIPESVRSADDATWRPLGRRPALAGSRVLIVGYGSVGRAIVSRFAAFEVELTAVASRARDGDDLVERVHGVDELPELLPHQDVVVVITPLGDSTRGLVDDTFLSAMPEGALLVNVARGPVADTDALVKHAGRLRIALDVTDPEPLPDGHPLWSAPDVLITPHAGGNTSVLIPRMADLVREQLSGLVEGRDPIHLVRP
ncbi:phosphoglycerate dehydrogenase-like enzyme [Knoellia remsis]|uniref:Phosphoglycerate dehydrogenase-like enzyme n=1 Tax=Knoellia remsis TaxID=407159 RepID=A0A2T0UTQ4_9MICO|nr:2-hydroxyacid dehydrogenase [Knoellia remsis]PRY61305.1 phosphoglycerate dehydrogenase-like enzyme [Knoellia remsis]